MRPESSTSEEEYRSEEEEEEEERPLILLWLLIPIGEEPNPVFYGVETQYSGGGGFFSFFDPTIDAEGWTDGRENLFLGQEEKKSARIFFRLPS